MSGLRGDRGAASLLLLAVGLSLVSFAVGGAAVGAARIARHEARTAADFGALAGAARAFEGAEAACSRAAELVSVNGARMTSCELDGLEVTVRAEITVTPLPGVIRQVTAAARAGPVLSSPVPAGPGGVSGPGPGP